ncbi:hypothetical protein DFH06DRAFT_1467829 [Mycena polygramma]|nr:hypothetical protein DFH06DRAFT_1467829 [Mycena polygramma]
MKLFHPLLISGFESGLMWDILMAKPPTAAMLLQLLRIDALPSLDSDSTFFIYIYHFSILDGPLGDMQKVINWVEEELGTVLLDFYGEVVKISDIRKLKNHARPPPFDQLAKRWGYSEDLQSKRLRCALPSFIILIQNRHLYGSQFPNPTMYRLFIYSSMCTGLI